MLRDGFTTVLIQIINDCGRGRIAAVAMNFKPKIGFNNDQVFSRRLSLTVEDDLVGLIDQCLKNSRTDRAEQLADNRWNLIDLSCDSDDGDSAAT